MSEDNTEENTIEEGATEEVSAEENATEENATEASSQDHAAHSRHDNVNLETLLKVPVNLSIEVGRTQMSLNEVLDTKEGTIVELERLLDEPLDILVNGALVAHGVVVLANERFGIQITDVVSLQERVQNLA